MESKIEPTAEELRAVWDDLAKAMGWRTHPGTRCSRKWLQEGVEYAKASGAAERCPAELAAAEELLR